MRPELEAVLRSVAQIPTSELPTLLGELEVIRATAAARMSAPTLSKSHSEQLLNIAEAAKRLNVSEDYLYRHWKTLPFARKYGWGLRFRSSGLNEYITQKNGRLRNY